METNFEKVYEAYKVSNNKVIIINGVEYFRIIEKNKICNYQMIVIPNNIFSTVGNRLKDEMGNIFTVGNPVHYSFKDRIPEWYLKTVSVMVKDTTINKIGEYVTLVK